MNNSHYLCLTWNAKLKVKVKHVVGVHDSEFCSNAISQTPRCNRFSVDDNHLVVFGRKKSVPPLIVDPVKVRVGIESIMTALHYILVAEKPA